MVCPKSDACLGKVFNKDYFGTRKWEKTALVALRVTRTPGLRLSKRRIGLPSQSYQALSCRIRFSWAGEITAVGIYLSTYLSTRQRWESLGKRGWPPPRPLGRYRRSRL